MRFYGKKIQYQISFGNIHPEGLSCCLRRKSTHSHKKIQNGNNLIPRGINAIFDTSDHRESEKLKF